MGRKEDIEQLTRLMNDPSTFPEVRKALRARIGGKMTREVYEKYSKQVLESDGFDVDDFPDSDELCKLMPYTINEHTLPEIIHFSRLAIDEYNKTEIANFEFVEVEKANIQLAGPLKFYVTFKAKNRDVDGTAQAFQALIFQGFVETDIEVKFCRLKPKPGQGGDSYSQLYPVYV